MARGSERRGNRRRRSTSVRDSRRLEQIAARSRTTTKRTGEQAARKSLQAEGTLTFPHPLNFLCAMSPLSSEIPHSRWLKTLWRHLLLDPVEHTDECGRVRQCSLSLDEPEMAADLQIDAP